MGQSASAEHIALFQVGFHKGGCLTGVTWTTENPYWDDQKVVAAM